MVATGVDQCYRTDDVCDDLATELFVRAIAGLARVARIHDVPVLVTRARDDEFSGPLANAVDDADDESVAREIAAVIHERADVPRVVLARMIDEEIVDIVE